MTFRLDAVVRLRAQQRPHEGQTLRHELGAVHGDLALHDAAHLAEGGGDRGAGGEVGVRAVGDEDVFERNVEVQVIDLRFQVLAVVDDVGGAHFFAEGLRFGAGGGGDDDGEVEDVPGDLGGHGADAWNGRRRKPSTR